MAYFKSLPKRPIPTFANAFSRGDIIDTTERIIGMFMGKPMYQKVVDIGTLPNATTKKVEHGISNLERIISQDGYTTDGNVFGILPYVVAGDGNQQSNVYLDKTYVYITTKINRTSYSGYIIFRYTKTTDTANTIKYGTGNDYSLDEQIVGTWIDGKPLYQKTINFGAGPKAGAANAKSVSHGISNINEVVSMNSIAMTGSGSNFWANDISLYIAGDGTDYNKMAGLYIIGDKVYICSLLDTSSFKYYITLQYTKTTY